MASRIHYDRFGNVAGVAYSDEASMRAAAGIEPRAEESRQVTGITVSDSLRASYRDGVLTLNGNEYTQAPLTAVSEPQWESFTGVDSAGRPFITERSLPPISEFERMLRQQDREAEDSIHLWEGGLDSGVERDYTSVVQEMFARLTQQERGSRLSKAIAEIIRKDNKRREANAPAPPPVKQKRLIEPI